LNSANIILDCPRTICLDTKAFKPLPYKENIVSETKELTLPSRIESVDEAAMAADEFAKKVGLGDDFISSIDLAIRESVANAVKHGNKFDESKTVEVKLFSERGGFGISVRDHGPGFDIDGIPDPTNPENLLKTNGRGILFMRSFMDEVEWENAEGGGMVVKMFKKG
jgi:serine/threonine-protein kinase RsbW